MSLELCIRESFQGGFELDLELSSDSQALAFFGPSGAGKTTVLEVIAGWRRPREGRVCFGGRTLLDTGSRTSLSTAARAVGYVPQDLLLFPHRTVWGNVTAGVHRRARVDAGRIARAIDVLELDALRRRAVDTLSGGERQRVALARAICSRPDLLLLDEPLGGLDRPLRRRILPYLIRVREEFGTPMVFVSHDATEVEALCDEVCILREGRIVDRGRPAEVFSGDEGVRAVGADLENVIAGVVSEVGEGTATLELETGLELVVPRSGLERGQRALVSVRSDDVLIATERPVGLSARNLLPARVRDVTERSGEVLLRADLGQRQRVSVQLTPDAVRELELGPGRGVFLVIKTRACRVLATTS